MKTSVLNIGPQHPAVHGVLRLILETNGETVKKVTPEIGFLHRGTEKLCEYLEYYKILPFFSRFDYVSTLSGEQLYSLALEKALNVNIPQYSQILRIILVELIRISNHFLAITAMAMDTGALTPFLWAFEEREEICQFFELVSGARMHTAIIRPGGVNTILTWEAIDQLTSLLTKIKTKIDEIFEILSCNRIFISRLKSIGQVPYKGVREFSMSGPMARASGGYKDLRKTKPYDSYMYSNKMCHYYGDCLDRYTLRVNEMYESLNILQNILPFLILYYKNTDNIPVYTNCFKIVAPNKFNIKQTMESVIHDFKMYSEGYHLAKYTTYVSIDAPKGEYGVTLVGCEKNRPHRLKLRAPGFHHLQSLNYMASNELISNLLAILGSIDIVMGEIDK